MINLIITDNLHLNRLPYNISLQTKTISPEVVKILFDASTKDQINFKYSECETIFKETVGPEYTADNFPRKYIKGDIIVYVSYFKPRKNNDDKPEEKDSLLYRLILIQ